MYLLSGMKPSFLHKIDAYWACQLLGWGSAAIYWSYYQISFETHLLLEILSVLFPFVGSILSTHYYKKLAHQYKWIQFSLLELIPILLLGLIILTLIYCMVCMLIFQLTIGSILSVDGFLGMATGGLRYNAIWLLAFHLYHYAWFKRQGEIDQNKYEKLAIKAQLNQLNAQLNPHFLFNALNSIKALTLENPTAARKAIDLLSSILRASLENTNHQTIPLKEEIERTEAYLKLEQIRFEERLQYEWNIAEDLWHIAIPPLSLFNLVENAIKHGISQSKQGGIIKISGVVEQNTLKLSVINTGQLQIILSDGLGLRNIEERLQLVYGNAAKFILQSTDNQEVIAILEIPVITSHTTEFLSPIGTNYR
ncbi:MAG: histidine kinase [Bacteroidota bacterium]